MAKFLFLILVGFVVSTNVLFGEDVCSHYDDEDCVHPNITKNGHYTNQWSVYMPGISKDEAKQLLEDNGFDYLGQIVDGLELYLVTRKGTFEKHAMPDEKTIELLKKHKQVHSVAQKHVFENSADEVSSIVNNAKVNCQSLDPSKIKLNDGSENLKRAQEREGGEAAATMYTAARPVSSSGSVDLHDEQLNNNHTLSSAAVAMIAGEKHEDIAAALMATLGVAASDPVMASTMTAADSLPPMNEWMLAGNGSPYNEDMSSDALALEMYQMNEYLSHNMKTQDNFSNAHSFGERQFSAVGGGSVESRPVKLKPKIGRVRGRDDGGRISAAFVKT